MNDAVEAAVNELAKQLVPLQPEERLQALRQVAERVGMCVHCGVRKVGECYCTNDE